MRSRHRARRRLPVETLVAVALGAATVLVTAGIAVLLAALGPMLDR